MSFPSDQLPGYGGDFAKGASGPTNVYDTSPTGLGLSPAYLAPGAVSSSTATASTSTWSTGDYKVSAQASDHADVGGGMWLLCDGSSIDSQYTGLIATIGADRPDARGRTLVMQGTNASVSSLLANDGQSVANRRPHHRTTNSLAVNPITIWAAGGGGAGGNAINVTAPAGNRFGDNSTIETQPTIAGSIGTNNSNDALDTPSFIVPGNLFIHT